MNSQCNFDYCIITQTLNIALCKQVQKKKNFFSMLIFTSFNNKGCCDIAYFNTKMPYLSDFKRTKSKTLRTAKQSAV